MAEEAAEPKVKQEKTDIGDDVPVTGGDLDPDKAPVKGEDKEGKIKDEKKDEKKIKSEGESVKGEGVKGEPSVKKESSFKEESVKGESAKNESTKGEPKVKSEGMKGEGSKKEEAKGELAKQEMKTEAKRERSRSRKKDKKDKKVKKERGDSPAQKKKKDKKDKKRGRSGSPGGKERKRKSKWGPDVPAGFSMTAVPGGRSGLVPMPAHDENLPRFNEEETTLRTVVLDGLPSHCTGQELIEFFNGAVLAVTANAVQQAANKNMAPVYACTILEEDRGGSRKKVADLKFRTPDGASVGMKLNGIEYKGHKLLARRPEGFPLEDGDPASKISLQDMSMARLIGATPGPGGKIGGDGVSPKLSIFNLPEIMSEQVVRDLLSQFGKLRMMSLIRDLATGKIKGYGIFEYDDPNDVELAILALNGFVCGQNVIRVQQLGAAAQQGAAPKAQPVAATAMSNSMTQKIVSNPVLAMQVKQGREVGSRPSVVVQMINAVYQEDLMDDQDYDDIMSEVHTMASKHGGVARVVIPKPAKDGAYIEGVGKIFVCFQDMTAARKFQLDVNGRKFEHRVVCASFYPMEKFTEGKFKLWTA